MPSNTDIISNLLGGLPENSITARADTLRRRDMLTAAEFADLTRRSEREVEIMGRRAELLALYAVGIGVRYPAWQVRSNGSTLEGALEILVFCDYDAWAALQILVDEYPDGSTNLVHEVLQAQTASEVLAFLTEARHH